MGRASRRISTHDVSRAAANMSGGRKTTRTNEGGSAMFGMPGTSVSATPLIANTIGSASPTRRPTAAAMATTARRPRMSPVLGTP